jgi:hypothetical protein
MLLSVWHAPIPWFHVHAVAGPAVEHNLQLQRHLGEFHPGLASEVAENAVGWHVHLILPWQSQHKGDCDSQESHPDGSDCIAGLKFGSAFSPSQSSLSLNQLLCASTWPTLIPPADLQAVQSAADRKPALGAPTGFFASFGASIAICDLIDRHLC